MVLHDLLPRRAVEIAEDKHQYQRNTDDAWIDV